MNELEAEAAELETKLATAEQPDFVTLHPKALEQYLAAIDHLAESIAEGRDEETLMLRRGLVQKIAVYPQSRSELVRFDITGNLFALLDSSVGKLVTRGWHTLSHLGIEPPPDLGTQHPTFVIHGVG